MPEKYLQEFTQLSHEDKYNKVLVYLDALKQSEPNMVGLYALVEDLGPSRTSDAQLNEIYTSMLSLIDYEKIAVYEEKLAHQKMLHQKHEHALANESAQADILLETL